MALWQREKWPRAGCGRGRLVISQLPLWMPLRPSSPIPIPLAHLDRAILPMTQDSWALLAGRSRHGLRSAVNGRSAGLWLASARIWPNSIFSMSVCMCLCGQPHTMISPMLTRPRGYIRFWVRRRGAVVTLGDAMWPVRWFSSDGMCVMRPRAACWTRTGSVRQGSRRGRLVHHVLGDRAWRRRLFMGTANAGANNGRTVQERGGPFRCAGTALSLVIRRRDSRRSGAARSRRWVLGGAGGDTTAGSWRRVAWGRFRLDRAEVKRGPKMRPARAGGCCCSARRHARWVAGQAPAAAAEPPRNERRSSGQWAAANERSRARRRRRGTRRSRRNGANEAGAGPGREAAVRGAASAADERGG